MNLYTDLKVWQKAMDLSEQVYKLVNLLPKYETYALSDQIRRSAISIPSNIAEGQGRNSVKEFIQFLTISRGSCYELHTQITLAVRIGYFSKEQANATLSQCVETSKMLTALIKSLISTNKNYQKPETINR